VKVGYIVNPAAGKKQAVERINQMKRAALDRGFEAAAYITEGFGDAAGKGQRAVDEGCDVVVAVGGDGTVSELVNGILGSGAVMGIIPAGSGNDFARTLGIPSNFDEALGCILNGRIRSIDIGVVNDRYFVNVASVGFDARVAMETNKIKKRVSGPLAYVLGVFKTLAEYKPFDIELETETEKIRKQATLVALANGKYYGGGMKIAPGAVPDDGLLEVYVVDGMSRLKILRLFPLIYSGRHTGRPEVRGFRAKSVNIRCQNGYINSDGEVIGQCPASFGIMPAALDVIVP
jgi:YegS/Rv2252/BmrU family lipid kinase